MNDQIDNTSETIRTEFRVATYKLQGLEQAVGRLARRAAKIGSAPIAIAIDRNDVERRQIGGSKDFPVFANFVKVVVTGEAPKIAGWNLVARLTFDVGAVVALTVPGEAVPAGFRENNDRGCDHCNSKRVRKDVFIVRNEFGYKQVGSDCLADFLGHQDPKLLAAQAEILFAIDDLAGFGGEDEEERQEWDGYGYKEEHLYQLLPTVAYARSYSRKLGWVAASAGFGQPSAQIVRNLLCGRKLTKEDRATLEEIGPSDEDLAFAEAAIAWAAALEEPSDFAQNLRAIAKSGFTSGRTWGFACAIAGCYDRHLVGVREKAVRAARPIGVHVGTVGERADFDLFLVSSKKFDGQFGVQTLFRFTDRDGNTVIWWTGDKDLPEGEWIRVKGTVKKHSVYRDFPQTELSRCVQLPSDEEQAAIDDLSDEAKAVVVHNKGNRFYQSLRNAATGTDCLPYTDADAELPPLVELIAKGWVKANDHGEYTLVGDGLKAEHVIDAVKPKKAKRKAAAVA